MTPAPPEPPRPARRAGHEAVLAGAAILLAGAACYLRMGYDFGAGDHDDLLPELLRRLDPSLYPTDPFVMDRAAGVSVRGVLVALLHALSSTMPVPVAVAIVHVLSFSATAWGIVRLTRVLLPERPLAALLAPATVTAVFVYWTLGQNSLVYPALVPEAVAWAFVIHALAGVAAGRWLLPAVLVGVAAWFHGITGLIVALALAATIAAGGFGRARPDRWPAMRSAATFALVFTAVAAPFLVPVLVGQAGEVAGGVPSGFDLFVRLRLPHHLLPTAFPAGRLFRFVVLAVVGGAALIHLSRRGELRDRGFVGRFLLVAAALCVVGTVGVLAFESLAIARAQPFKLTVLANVLFVIGLCGVAERWITATVPGLLPRPAGWLATTAALAGLTLVLALADIGRAGSAFRPRAHRASDEGRLEAWARVHTEVDDLFIVPVENTSFRVGARRGAFVTWKAHSFRSDEMRDWLRHIQTVAPAPWREDGPAGFAYRDRLQAAYCRNDDAAWSRIATETRAQYAVVSVGCGAPKGALLFRAGRLSVYALEGTSGAASERSRRTASA